MLFEKPKQCHQRPKRLEYKNIPGAGKQIHADIDDDFYMGEFIKLRGSHIIATEPWIQFKPKKWDSMIEQVFIEMITLWNEKYAI